MNVTEVKRITLSLVFSRALEYRLLSTGLPHTSLTHDLETCTLKGLELLQELEDVTEIKHIAELIKLIEETNRYLTLESEHFNTWYIAVSEDLLDAIDLAILTHGDDLLRFGLEDNSREAVLILLTVAGLYHPALQYPE